MFSGSYEITNIEIEGLSNSHDDNASVNAQRNDKLAASRAQTIKDWLVNYTTIQNEKFSTPTHKSSVKVNDRDVNSLQAKAYRSTKVVIHLSYSKTENLSDSKTEQENNETVYNRYKGFSYVGEYKKSGLQQFKDEEGNEWFLDEGKGEMYRTIQIKGKKVESRYEIDGDKKDVNTFRYDQEYHFFKRMEKDDPIVFKKLTEKLQYFDPAFHSMTPEGFTERLTFLQQCTRQGNTISASDGVNGKTASNLAFGRPPFCVLRIGDFYYQTIVIDSVNIDYNVSGGLQWDLNPEGAGVQPMLAQVNINFKFIGGGDLGGPIRRLQNAMTFNYYSNSRLHDNRADRIKYNGDDVAMGAIDHSVKTDGSYAYKTKMAD